MLSSENLIINTTLRIQINLVRPEDELLKRSRSFPSPTTDLEHLTPLFIGSLEISSISVPIPSSRKLQLPSLKIGNIGSYKGNVKQTIGVKLKLD